MSELYAEHSLSILITTLPIEESLSSLSDRIDKTTTLARSFLESSILCEKLSHRRFYSAFLACLVVTLFSYLILRKGLLSPNDFLLVNYASLMASLSTPTGCILFFCLDLLPFFDLERASLFPMTVVGTVILYLLIGFTNYLKKF